MLALRIVEVIFPLVAIASIGFLYGRRHRPEMEVANRINLEVFLPALIFSTMSSRSFDVATYAPLAMAALVIVLGSGLLAWPLSRYARFAPKTFVLPVMFTNAGNMGLPLLLLAFGEEIIAVAMVLFLVENTLHFTVGVYLLDRRAKLLSVLGQPLVVAAFIGLVMSFAGWRLPASVALPIDMLGQICIPLMIFSLGVRLANADLGEWRIGLAAAVATPVIGVMIALPLVELLDLTGAHAGALIVFGALPPAVLNYILAEKYQTQPAKVASIVIIGNLFALISIPLTLAYVLPRYG